MDAAKMLARRHKWADLLDEKAASHRLSLRGLALASGVPITTLQNLRAGTGQMSLRMAAKLAPWLDMTLDELAEIELSDG